MAQIVELPNGDSIEFSDDMTPDAMSSAISSSFPEFSPKPPGLIDRVKAAWGAGSNAKAPEGLTDASFDAGVPDVAAQVSDAATQRHGSVMSDYTAPPSSSSRIETRGAPVTQEAFDSVQRAYDAATPEQRRKMALRQDAIGSVVQAIEQSEQEGDPFSNRREDRIARKIKEGASPETAAGIVGGNIAFGAQDQALPQLGETPERPSVSEQARKDWRRGLTNAKSIYYGLNALAADVAGLDHVTTSYLDDYLSSTQEAQANAPVIGTYKNVKKLGDAGRYAVEAVMENLPMMLPSLVTGGVGATVARKGAESLVAGMIEKQVAQGISRNLAERKAAAYIAQKTMQGMVAGVLPSTVGMESGSIYGDVFEKTGQRRAGLALGYGIPAGMLDAIEPVMALRKIAGPLANELGGHILRRFGTEVGKQFIAEAGTEGLQTILEKAAVSQADGRKLLTQETLDDVIDSMLKGGIGGAVMGGGSQSVAEGRAALSRITPADIIATKTTDDAIAKAAESVSADADLGNVTDEVSNLLGRIDLATTNTGMGQAPTIAPVAELTPGGFAPEASPVSAEAAYEQAAQAEEKAQRATAFDAQQTGAGGDPVDLAIRQAEAANTRQAAIDANPVIETAMQREIRKLRELQVARQSEESNGPVPATTPAEVAAPGAQTASAELPGSASLPSSAPAGNAGAIGRGAEVAAPGVRPAVSAGDAGNSSVTTVRSDSSLNRVASWVIRNKETGAVVMETYDKAKVDALNTAKYEAVPIASYLGEAGVTPAKSASATRNAIDHERDSLFTAIAKLGGISTSELTSNGVDPASIHRQVTGKPSKKTGQLPKPRSMPVSMGFNLPLHKASGMSFDGVLEQLKQYGYFPEDATKNDVIDAFSRELSGDRHFTATASELMAQQDAESRDAEMLAEQTRIDAEAAAEDAARDDIGYDELSVAEQSAVDALADFDFFAPGAAQDEAAAMRAMGFTEDEINVEQRRNEESASANAARAEIPAQGNIPEGNATRTGENAGAERQGEGLTLAGQTNAQASAEYRAQQEEAAKKDAAPATPTVKADQVDLFNAQGGLFNSNRDVSKKSEKLDTSAEPVQKTAETEQVGDPVAQAKATLDAAGVTGTDRTSTIAAVRRGDLTAEDVAEAHPAKASEAPAEPAIKTYPKAQAERMMKSFTGQGMPTEVYAHNGAWALRATSKSDTQFSNRREIDDNTGLPLNSDGTVTVYHHTSKENAERIQRTGSLKADAEPDVYVTTRKEADTGYGDTAVPIRVNPDLLTIDDEFPNGRKDFRLSVGKHGGSIKVGVTKFRTRSEQLIEDGNWDELAAQTFPDVAGSEQETTQEPAPKAEPIPDAPIATERTAKLVQTTLAAQISSRPNVTIHNGLKAAGTLSRNTLKAINATAKIFKQRVVYFESDRPTADGFIQNGTIYLNVDASVSPLAVLGHELTHRLQNEQPESWQAVAQVMAARMDRTKLIAMYRSYHGSELTDAQIIEKLQDEKALEDLMAEMVSDYAGNQFTDEAFWSDVFGQMAKGKPEGVVRKLVERLRLTVMKMVGLMNKAINQPGFRATWLTGEENTANWGNDVNAALKSAYAQWVDAINTTGYEGIRESHAAKFSPSSHSSYEVLPDPSPEEAQTVQRGIEGKSAIAAAEFVAKNAIEPSHRLIAQRVAVRLKQLEEVGAIFSINVAHTDEQVPEALTRSGVRGVVIQRPGDKKTDIWLQGADMIGKVGVSYETVLHELVHAATQKAIDLGEHKAGGEIGAAVKGLDNVYQFLINRVREKVRNGDELTPFENSFHTRRINSMANRHELVSWAMTNKETQQYLESIPYRNTTLWDGFVSAVRQFLGLPAHAETALSEVIGIGDNLLNLRATDLMLEAMRQGVQMQINYPHRTIANTSESMAGNGNTRYSPRRADQENVGDRFTIPAENKYTKTQRLLQDSSNRWQIAQDAVKEQGGIINDATDVALAITTYPGRVGAGFENFNHNIVEPLLERMAKAKVSMENIGLYLYALHAHERNAEIAKKNPRFPDGGSGMTNADAAQVIADFKALPNFAEIDQLAKDFRKISERRIDMLVRTGVMAQEQADAYRAAYKDYVPLKGFEDVDENGKPTGTGKGFSTGSKIDKRALGRGSRAGQIIENIVSDFEQAIILAEKTNVGKVVRNFVAANPDAKLWEIDHPPLTQVLSSSGNVFSRTAQYDPEAEIQFLDEGKPVRVQLHDQGLLRAYNNLASKELDVASKLFNTYNGWLRQMYTQKNPAWFFLNFFKDQLSAFPYLTGERGFQFAAKSIANVPKTMQLAWAMYHKKPINAADQRLVDLFRKNGGMTGFAYVGDIEAKSLQLHGALNKYQTWSETRNHGMQAMLMKSVNNKFFDYIEAYNTTFENASRLAAFKTAIENGISPKQAAELSKNVTVNFNRRGEYGPVINAWFLFANAGIQGTRNIGHALFFSKHKEQVWALATGAVMLGLMASLGSDDDDDLIDDNTRSRSLAIKTGDSKVLIPMPYGWGFFSSLGQLLGQSLKHPEKREKIALKMASSAFDHFGFFGNPLAGDELSLKAAVANTMPTAPRPFVQNALNVSSFGGPIYPESQFNKTQPDSEKAWRKTKGTAYDQFSKWLNSISGGDTAAEGVISVSPESLKQMTSTLGGGALRLVTDSISLPFEASKEGLVKAKNVPLVKNFYQAIDADDYRRRFNESAARAENAAKQAAGYRKALSKPDATQKTKDDYRKFIESDKLLIGLGGMAIENRKHIAALRDQEDALRAETTMPADVRKLRLQQNERAQIAATKQFDAAIKRANQ